MSWRQTAKQMREFIVMKIAIIGAGLSGIAAAKTLNETLGQKADIQIFEKSRGAGGRMSTRRADAYEFDHGAQYFTAKDPAFRTAVNAAIAQGHIASWHGKARYLKNKVLEEDTGADRFVSTPRMNSWIKAMTHGLNIHLSARVTKLIKDGSVWTLELNDGKRHAGFDAVICAAPSPQAEALLAPTGFTALNAIKNTKMDACFAVMLGFKTALNLPWDTLRSPDGAASWIALNSAKPNRPKGLTTLMIHSGPIWSNTNVDTDKLKLQAQIIDAASELTGLDLTTADYNTIHRWLYAAVSEGAGSPCLSDSSLQIITCGDWCLGGRVEGAWLSGKAAAEQVISWA